MPLIVNDRYPRNRHQSVDAMSLADREVLVQLAREARSNAAHVQTAERALSATSATDANAVTLATAQTVTGAKAFTGANRYSRSHLNLTLATWTVTTESVIFANSVSNAITITLPTAVGNLGREIIVKRTGSALNSVTIVGPSSQTIDGAANKTLAVNESVVLHSNNTNWFILATYP